MPGRLKKESDGMTAFAAKGENTPVISLVIAHPIAIFNKLS
jgi:hypothetical protein